MKSKVKHLNTVKRRAWVWQDKDGYVWFWSATRQGWAYLDHNQFGFYVADTMRDPDDPSWWDQPFRKLFKNFEFDKERSLRDRPLDE